MNATATAEPKKPALPEIPTVMCAKCGCYVPITEGVLKGGSIVCRECSEGR